MLTTKHHAHSLFFGLKIAPALVYALLSFSPLHADHVIFLVHGTWASTAEWPTADGDFFKAIETSAEQQAQLNTKKEKLPAGRSPFYLFSPNISAQKVDPEKTHPQKTHVVPFTWTGQKKAVAREQAARKLVKIMQSYPQDTKFSVVAHSHGVNVTLLASHYLAQAAPDAQRRIEALYALAGPVKETRYSPNMNIINYVYNLFSFGDIVQPIFNKWHRVFEPHERIANLAVTINGVEPDHSQIHDPIVGTFLPLLDQKLRAAHADTLFSEPGSLHFTNHSEPLYLPETYEARTQRLEEDLTHVKRRWVAFLANKAMNAIAETINPQANDPQAQELAGQSGQDNQAINLVSGTSSQASAELSAQKRKSWLPAFAQKFRWFKSSCVVGSQEECKEQESSDPESEEDGERKQF